MASMLALIEKNQYLKNNCSCFTVKVNVVFSLQEYITLNALYPILWILFSFYLGSSKYLQASKGKKATKGSQNKKSTESRSKCIKFLFQCFLSSELSVLQFVPVFTNLRTLSETYLLL